MWLRSEIIFFSENLKIRVFGIENLDTKEMGNFIKIKHIAGYKKLERVF